MAPSPSRAWAFDYQSDQHCAKTNGVDSVTVGSLITSQINTAPKLEPSCKVNMHV